jgi:uncharacterized protein YbjT (DUF2867 family)
VVEAAVEAGFDTVAHVRPDSPRLDHWRARFAAQGASVDTTAWEADAMRATLHDLAPSVVFALLGTTRARGGDYERVDYGLTILLLEAARDCGSSPRFVYLSSLGAGPRARGAYMSARWRVEEAVRASGLSYAIARPTFITGPDRDERRPAEHAAAALGDGALGLVAALGGRRLRERFRSTTNVVLARALVRLGGDRSLGDRVFMSEELR